MSLNVEKLLPLVDVSRRGHMNFHYAAATIRSACSGLTHVSYNDSCPRYRDFLSRRCHCSSVHAEQRAVTRLFRQLKTRTDGGRLSPRDVRRRLKGYKLVTLRSREHKPGYEGMTYDGYDVISAIPCGECVKFLRNYGFRKIYYTDDMSNVIKVNVRDLQDGMHGLSDAQNVYRLERHLRSGQIISLDPQKYLKPAKHVN